VSEPVRSFHESAVRRRNVGTFHWRRDVLGMFDENQLI